MDNLLSSHSHSSCAGSPLLAKSFFLRWVHTRLGILHRNIERQLKSKGVISVEVVPLQSFVLQKPKIGVSAGRNRNSVSADQKKVGSARQTPKKIHVQSKCPFVCELCF